MRILRTQKSAHALSIILCLIGVLSIFVTLWQTWSLVSSAENPFSTFLGLLWTESLDFIPFLEFKLIYLVVLGDTALVLGVLVWVLSRQWLHLPGKTVWFKCPFCKKKWRSTGDKALVHCPYCRQLVHPKLTEK